MAATSMLIDHRLSSGPLWLTRHFHLDNTPVGVTLAVVLVAVTWWAAHQLTRRARVD